MTSDTRLLRYRYPDGRMQGAFPMHVVEERPDAIVGWLAAGTEVSYWATANGTDPRTVPLEQRFRQHLGTARRTWQGGGILRYIPFDEHWQVLHFWDSETGGFLGWYVNLEAAKTTDGDRLDTVDWHLDLLISPSFEVTWKDEDEVEAARGTDYLRDDDVAAARAVGQRIAADPHALIDAIGDWRAYAPPAEWGPLSLPPDWDRPAP